MILIYAVQFVRDNFILIYRIADNEYAASCGLTTDEYAASCGLTTNEYAASCGLTTDEFAASCGSRSDVYTSTYAFCTSATIRHYAV